MVVVIGEFRLPSNRIEEARPIMRKVIEATLTEAGCISYSYAHDTLDQGLIRVSEAWESAEHLTAHLQTRHMQIWTEEREKLGLTGRELTRYEVTDATRF